MQWNGAYAGAASPSAASNRVGYASVERKESNFKGTTHGVVVRRSRDNQTFAHDSGVADHVGPYNEVQRVHMYTGANDSIWEWSTAKLKRFSIYGMKRTQTYRTMQG